MISQGTAAEAMHKTYTITIAFKPSSRDLWLLATGCTPVRIGSEFLTSPRGRIGGQLQSAFMTRVTHTYKSQATIPHRMNHA